MAPRLTPKKMKTRSKKISEIYRNQVCFKSVCICQLHKVYKARTLYEGSPKKIAGAEGF